MKKDIYFDPKKNYGSKQVMLKAFNEELAHELSSFVYRQQHGWNDLAVTSAINISIMLTYAREIGYVPEDGLGETLNEMFNSLSELSHLAIKSSFAGFKCKMLHKFVQNQLKNTYFLITDTKYLLYSTIKPLDIVNGYFRLIYLWVKTKLGFISWKNIKFGYPRIIKGYRSLSKFTGLKHSNLIKAIDAQHGNIKNLNKDFVDSLL